MGTKQEQRDRERDLDLLRRMRCRSILCGDSQMDKPYRTVPLIDADSIAYRVAHSSGDDLAQGKRSVDEMIQSICNSTLSLVRHHNRRMVDKADENEFVRPEKDHSQVEKMSRNYSSLDLDHTDPILFLTLSQSFRSNIFPSYKSGRASTKSKLNMEAVEAYKTYMMRNYTCTYQDGLEADDMVLYYHYNWENFLWGVDTKTPHSDITYLPIVVSEDKDVQMQHPDLVMGYSDPDPFPTMDPGMRFPKPDGSEQKKYFDHLNRSFIFPYYQTIMGDPADSIPGVPGYGVSYMSDRIKDLIGDELKTLRGQAEGMSLMAPVLDSALWSVGKMGANEMSSIIRGEDNGFYKTLSRAFERHYKDEGELIILEQNYRGALSAAIEIYIEAYGPFIGPEKLRVAERMVHMLKTEEQVISEVDKRSVDQMNMNMTRIGSHIASKEETTKEDLLS